MSNESTALRVRRHREMLRTAGLRPLQIWVPDTRRKGFAQECRRQSLLLRHDREETRLDDWLRQVADTDGWH